LNRSAAGVCLAEAASICDGPARRSSPRGIHRTGPGVGKAGVRMASNIHPMKPGWLVCGLFYRIAEFLVMKISSCCLCARITGGAS